MSGYISRSKLIKAVENLPDCYNGFSDTYDKACIIGLIAEQPSIEEPQKPKWIPVTERLPDAGKKVLVFAYGYDTITARMCKKTESGYPVFECKGYDGIYREMARAGRITHWMPIPEPPKDGES